MSEILDADDVFWDSNARNVTIKKGDKKVVLSADTGKVTINGEQLQETVDAEIVDGTVMVPLRFISEIFDAKVDWNEDKRRITITSDSDKTYKVLDMKNDVTENTKVMSYEDALQAAINKNSSLKNLDDSLNYLQEARDDISNNLKMAEDSYASYSFLLSAAANDGLTDTQALQAQVTSSISSTISAMNSMKSADVNKSLKGVNEEMIKDSVEVTLKNYITSIKTAKMNIALLEENVKLGQENIENMELKLSVGMESEQNVSTAKLEQKTLESNLESAKLSLSKLKQSLNNLIGADANDDIEIEYTVSFDKIDDVQLESYVAMKTQNDPSIKVLKSNVELAEYAKRIKANATNSEKISLTNDINTATRKLTDGQDSMATNIRTAYDSIKQLEEQNKANKAKVQKAIEDYNSVVVSYQAGMATNYQVSQAKLGILNAEIALEQNAIDYDMLTFTFYKPYMLSSSK